MKFMASLTVISIYGLPALGRTHERRAGSVSRSEQRRSDTAAPLLVVGGAVWA
jgi:hypothetical protein